MEQRLRDIGNRDVSMIVTVQSGGGAETERHWKQRCINDRDSAERCWSRDIGNRDVSMIVTVQSGGGAETERHWKQRCINDRDSAERWWSRD